MVHSIELSESFEDILRKIAIASHKTEEDVLKEVAEIVLAHDAGKYGAAFQAHLRPLIDTESGSTVRIRTTWGQKRPVLRT